MVQYNTLYPLNDSIAQIFQQGTADLATFCFRKV